MGRILLKSEDICYFRENDRIEESKHYLSSKSDSESESSIYRFESKKLKGGLML
jgi:hypothetical protein